MVEDLVCKAVAKFVAKSQGFKLFRHSHPATTHQLLNTFEIVSHWEILTETNLAAFKSNTN